MNDKADVGFVDAHAEGVCRDHDALPVKAEIVLIFAPFFLGKPCMVARGGNAAVAQKLAHPLDACARGAVDDTGFSRARLHQLQRFCQLAVRMQHLKIEVRAVEARDVAKRVRKPQVPDDIGADLRGGGRREGGDDGSVRQRGQERRDFQIAWAEILPPLGDAVRLVDREKRHRHPCSQGKEALRLQPLRRDVQKLILSGGRFCIGASQLLERQRAVEKRRRYPCLRQRCYLVFHQGNERRDHNRQPRQQQRRKLIADRLSPAGRHHAQHIAPGQNRVNQRLLPAAERRVTEIPLEQRPFFLHRLLLSDA